jgi:phage terminase large subunit-like protein
MSVARTTLTNNALARWRRRPIKFIETVLIDPETHVGFELLPAERAFLEHAFTFTDDGRLLYREWVYSAPKKSGKTTFAALIIITMVLLFGGSFPEAFALANDQEQAQSRVFEFIKRIIQASPLLCHEAQITQYKITFPTFNATIQAIASDAGSAAGSNPVISCFDELWAYVSERSRRLFDKMNTPPTRKIACRLVVSYAGFTGESLLLEELYRRGSALPQVGDSLYAGEGLLMAWHHKPVAPWQDAAWLTSMRRERASVYQRHVLNEFASSSSQFIDMAKWDACTNPSLGTVPVDLFLPVWIGVDASVKHDSSAIVCVTFDTKHQLVRLVTHRIFQPTPEEPIDFESTIEVTLIQLKRSFQLKKVLFDPYQMQASAQRLAKQGVPVQEYPQTSGNLAAATMNLLDLIQAERLLVYPDQNIRTAMAQAIAVETPRGLRISKDKQSHKVDAVVALSMAALAAVRSQGESDFDQSWSWVDGTPIGSNGESYEARQAREAEANRQWRQQKFNNYLLSGGRSFW